MSTLRILLATGLRHACILLAIVAALAFGGDIHVHQVAADTPDTCLVGHSHGDTAGEDEGTACGHCDCPLFSSTLPNAWAGLAQTTSLSPYQRPSDDPALRGLNHQPEPPPVLG